MAKKANIEHSKFWLGKDFDLGKELGKGNTIDLLRLAAFRRAIANFVLILTGKSVPVRFSEKSGQSMTDGKVVYIGGDLSHGEFDATVGLSLHEAMHIAQSDFELIKTIWTKTPRKLYDAAGKKLSKSAVPALLKYVLNVVEDRFIDAWAYDAAPGYRGYYVALYNRYFNLPVITKAIKAGKFRKPTIKSYKFHFTNITNPARDLDALPGLRKIYETLDLENILRLMEPTDRMDLAVEITLLIIQNIVKEDEKKNQKSSGKGSGSGGLGDEPQEEEEEKKSGEEEIDEDDPLGGTIDKGAPKLSDEELQKELAGEEGDDEGNCGLNDDEVEELDKLIEKQEEVVNREIKQKEFDQDTIKKLDMLEKSGVGLVPVGGEMGIPKINCVVVKNMTKELMETQEFPYTTKHFKSFQTNQEAQEGVAAGVVLGAMLGRRLQVRGESRTTRFNRLEKGKFDRRMISDLGFDCGSVFYQTQTDQYKKAHLHISVDASSSMLPKWKRTMTTLVAIAKAASMVNNLSVAISFRSGAAMKATNLFCVEGTPYVVIAYDSRVDKFSKVTQLFPYLVPHGSTPEGLAFQAILDTIPSSSPDSDSYFVNLSDGEPAFNSVYFGAVAHNHTKKQVDKIRASGVEVLSYFVEVDGVSDERTQTNTIAFKAMYGKDAQIIDVNNVTEIAKTMNKKFLQKSD